MDLKIFVGYETVIRHANLMDKQTLSFSELRTKEILSGGVFECPAHVVLTFPNLFNKGNFHN